ncbi:MAG: class D sortase [Oscillospiraceae bacterium]|nr:class D sortase [Oscillospiraceae bacterium]
MMKNKARTKKQWALFLAGMIAVITGVSILSFLGIRKLYREYQKQKLMRENPVVEIAGLNIKAPILEGTDNGVLSRAAGHFPGTGDFGKGNYCIAGHSSTIYKEYFNNLKNVRIGMTVTLYDKDKKSCDYTVAEVKIVEPDETWVLGDFGDTRITIITCTDDGSQRLVVVGLLQQS